MPRSRRPSAAFVLEAGGWDPQAVTVTDLPFVRCSALISHKPQSIQTLSPFYRWGNRGPKRLSHLRQVSETQSRGIPGPRSLPIISTLLINAQEMRQVKGTAGNGVALILHAYTHAHTHARTLSPPKIAAQPEMRVLITSQASSAVVTTLWTPGVKG